MRSVRGVRLSPSRISIDNYTWIAGMGGGALRGKGARTLAFARRFASYPRDGTGTLQHFVLCAKQALPERARPCGQCILPPGAVYLSCLTGPLPAGCRQKRRITRPCHPPEKREAMRLFLGELPQARSRAESQRERSLSAVTVPWRLGSTGPAGHARKRRFPRVSCATDAHPINRISRSISARICSSARSTPACPAAARGKR